MTPYCMVLLLVLSFPMIKILGVHKNPCFLCFVLPTTQLRSFQHAGTVWFSIFLSGSSTSQKVRKVLFVAQRSFFLLLPGAAIFVYLET